MNRQDFIRLGMLFPLAAVLDARCTPPAAAQTVTAADFVKKAGTAGLFEIQSSELALTNALSQDVTAFAKRMISDHTVLAEELKTTVAGKYEVPSGLDKHHQSLIDDLKGAGKKLETAYVEMQLKGHEDAVALFGEYGKRGDDVALQAFAIKALPTLQMHYDMIRKISSKES